MRKLHPDTHEEIMNYPQVLIILCIVKNNNKINTL
jgi:hypothetical protein